LKEFISDLGIDPPRMQKGNVGCSQNQLKAFICDMSLVNNSFVCSMAQEQKTSSPSSIKVTGSCENQ